MDPIAIGPFQGINNRARETALGEQDLRLAENVDLAADGGLLRREGYALVSAGYTHSLWSHPQVPFALCVQAGQLLRVDEDGSLTDLGALAGNRAAFDVFADAVWALTDQAHACISLEGERTLWGLADPPAPNAEAYATGGLDAGFYEVSYVFRSATGVESGTPYVSEVELASGQGIRLTDIPTAADVAAVDIYVTAPDGDVPYRAASAAPGMAQYLIGAHQPGRTLRTQYARRAPHGTGLQAHYGRLYIIDDKTLWVTHAANPHVVTPHVGFFSFPTKITLTASVDDGIYVGTDRAVYFLAGKEPADMQQAKVSGRGAVEGSLVVLPEEVLAEAPSLAPVSWWSTDGLHVTARPGGQLQMVSESRFRAAQAAHGTGVYRERDGIKQILNVLRAGEGTEAQASDNLVGEVRRGGIVVSS